MHRSPLAPQTERLRYEKSQFLPADIADLGHRRDHNRRHHDLGQLAGSDDERTNDRAAPLSLCAKR